MYTSAKNPFIYDLVKTFTRKNDNVSLFEKRDPRLIRICIMPKNIFKTDTKTKRRYY